ncbi:MAG: hypothetical protein N3D11_16240 [Candidatus Sumerlaeia bacterium]|nr:hypothetical protein [Candidatus Sumerlaeia bacterium]
MIEETLQRLYQYCRAEDWKGRDPYDGLNSRLFQASPLARWRWARLAWIQLFKRLPFNLRPLLGVPKEENPKGLALFARGLLALGQARCPWAAPDDCDQVFARLKQMRSPGYDPWCWGYNFDWQGRAFFVRRFQPNAVATTFAAHAFLDRFEAFRKTDDLAIAESACAFVLRHLNRPHETPDAVCFSYTPFDHSVVHNINFLIAALFARTASITGDATLAGWAQRALAFSVGQQAGDGSWPYGRASFQAWVDHFHTCYNLLALESCCRALERFYPRAVEQWEQALDRGLTFYLERLFRLDGLPRPDTRARWPIDTHSLALAILTLTRFADRRPLCRHRRQKVVEWTLRRMQSRRGFFYYQKHALLTVRIPYMRWSEAWMFYALADLLAQRHTWGKPAPTQ